MQPDAFLASAPALDAMVIRTGPSQARPFRLRAQVALRPSLCNTIAPRVGSLPPMQRLEFR
jgi:hypothetical protein